MSKLKVFLNRGENKFLLLRISFGIVYFWFGVLKFFPNISPAETLAQDTIYNLVFESMPKHTGLILLAILECGIGLGFISGKYLKTTLIAAMLHMACTFTPFFYFTDLTFTKAPYAFTLVGQYIMKNIVFLAGMWILWPSNVPSNQKTKRKVAQLELEEYVI